MAEDDTKLHVDARNGDLESVRDARKKGADTSRKNGEGKVAADDAPAHIAAELNAPAAPEEIEQATTPATLKADGIVSRRPQGGYLAAVSAEERTGVPLPPLPESVTNQMNEGSSFLDYVTNRPKGESVPLPPLPGVKRK